jgi:hypothetical protein
MAAKLLMFLHNFLDEKLADLCYWCTDLDKIKRSIAETKDVNEYGRNGLTALQASLGYRNDYPVFEYLIDLPGINILMPSKDGRLIIDFINSAKILLRIMAKLDITGHAIIISTLLDRLNSQNLTKDKRILYNSWIFECCRAYPNLLSSKLMVYMWSQSRKFGVTSALDHLLNLEGYDANILLNEITKQDMNYDTKWLKRLKIVLSKPIDSCSLMISFYTVDNREKVFDSAYMIINEFLHKVKTDEVKAPGGPSTSSDKQTKKKVKCPTCLQTGTYQPLYGVNEDCPICMTNLNPKSVLKCGHYLCNQCLDKI